MHPHQFAPGDQLGIAGTDRVLELLASRLGGLRRTAQAARVAPGQRGERFEHRRVARLVDVQPDDLGSAGEHLQAHRKQGHRFEHFAAGALEAGQIRLVVDVQRLPERVPVFGGNALDPQWVAGVVEQLLEEITQVAAVWRRWQQLRAEAAGQPAPQAFLAGDSGFRVQVAMLARIEDRGEVASQCDGAARFRLDSRGEGADRGAGRGDVTALRRSQSIDQLDEDRRIGGALKRSDRFSDRCVGGRRRGVRRRWPRLAQETLRPGSAAASAARPTGTSRT